MISSTPMRVGETAELGQHLQRRVHGLGRERPAVEAAGAEPDHFLLAIDDFEGQIGADPHDDHVQRVGPDVDGGETHTVLYYNGPNADCQSDHVRIASTLRFSAETPRAVYKAVTWLGEGDVRAIHRTRVASRRLREILPVLQLKADVCEPGRRRSR